MISLEVLTHDDIGSFKKLPLEEKNRRGGRLLFQFPPSKHHWQNYYLSIFPLTKLNSHNKIEKKVLFFFPEIGSNFMGSPNKFFVFCKVRKFDTKRLSNQWHYLKNPSLWSTDAFYEKRQRKHIWASGHCSEKFKNTKLHLCFI